MGYFAGIDVGGTKIYTVVINDAGTILGRAKIKVGQDTCFDTVLGLMNDCYHIAVNNASLAEDQIDAVGASAPASVDRRRGLILHAPNLEWKNVKFLAPMKATFQKPFFLDNDVNLGAFAEFHLGAGKNYHSIYAMFIGTGIGGGYIIDGKIIWGVNYTAGEVGHTVIKIGGQRCSCGNRGCLESVSAKSGMIKFMKKAVDEHGQTTLLEKLEPDWRISLGSSALRKAWKKHDLIVMQALKRSADGIGIAAANLISITGVEAIILGGGLIEELDDFYLPRIKKVMRKNTMANGAKGVGLRKARLGDDAVALGCAWFVRQPENQELLF
ncbi:ROK family protein [Candidatus Moduliflexus flocculans]|uniref:ROK family protein n=1 Tax=Candidatus Moduliflexus flocculans TaxID=1499966 RepID=A0A0S6W5J4_9BACT|nr:ROK family protein [Candidatus Moduliflexus flocculans]